MRALSRPPGLGDDERCDSAAPNDPLGRPDALLWQTIIHLTLIVSAVALAGIDKMSVKHPVTPASAREAQPAGVA